MEIVIKAGLAAKRVRSLAEARWIGLIWEENQEAQTT